MKLDLIPILLSGGLCHDYFLDYNQELFCEAFLKPIVHGLYQTIILFHTGSFKIFGKDLEKMENSHILVQKIISHTITMD